ncbi:Macrolide export ATP-binding/permease protein MacB [Corynebacterium cystitidis DSM 20524]|uniref:Putative ABC transport system ATP-binding protein n=2 Tax=Corynebacterium cystitidis TaxID=35757 RepID=A0A1H9T6H5_9CORY|nr:ABC transporter ATP-binding protein [Corynebacterium cystitidis]WJY83475.1 Macrolide export ATP-binding/permease protein MacB [Corynebacterium cystitidis DSM 20524]SER92697.1 putative ABC transport system ATP-binding protein [Corynebacterium cystitidis DSM 20524]SNV92614.1 ABC-type transporter, ATPase component [Corynebacterium cystitidis]
MRVVSMNGITKTFNQGGDAELTVLHGVDMHVDEGEFVSIVGTSGSGKSTLMNIMGLLDQPTTGTYMLGDLNVADAQDDELAQLRSQNIGFVFQNFNLIPRMSSLRNVEMPMMYAGVPRSERTQRARELLHAVGMEERMDHDPAQLSGGQKQRVAIARAMANKPALILADEPTGALDTATGRMVMDLFHTLNSQGTTIVLITHNPELADETDRVLTMRDGVFESEHHK